MALESAGTSIWNLRLHRRDVLRGIASAAMAGMLGEADETMAAEPRIEEDFHLTIRRLIGDAKPQVGRVTVNLPDVAESGNSVPVTVRVDSPMTAADHVRLIHVVAERNPRPWAGSFYLGPRAGRAELETFLRLSDTQNVTAFAQMSDGSWWMKRTNVIVTIGACESMAVRY